MTVGLAGAVTTEKDMECPGCDGRKTVFAFLNLGEDYRKHRQGNIPCMTCGGTGEISAEHAARIEDGHRLYQERVARGETLMEAAIRQGMTPAQLSAIEHGRKPANAKFTGAEGVRCNDLLEGRPWRT